MAHLLNSALCSLVLAAGVSTQAASITYSLPDLNPSAADVILNGGQSFTGNGFIGMYDTGGGGYYIAHLLGMERNYTRTIGQVDIASLLGTAVTSAKLEFVLLDGTQNPQTVVVSSWHADGTLSFDWAPSSLLSSVHLVNGLAFNSLDVTGHVQARVAANEQWLGFHLKGSSEHHYTYTGVGPGPDAAQLRLVVEYETLQVPESVSSLVCLGIGCSFFALVRRKG